MIGWAHMEAGPMSPTLHQLTARCATCMPEQRLSNKLEIPRKDIML